MLGIDQDHVAGPTGQGIAQVVEGASHQPIAIGAMAAAWTGTPPVISALAADLGLGQVLDAEMPAVGSGRYSPGPGMVKLLEEMVLPGITPVDGDLFTQSAW